jgi:D-sedoheptulose 7-phosphate isomerase
VHGRGRYDEEVVDRVGLGHPATGVAGEADTIEHLFVVPSASVHRIQEAQTTTYNVLWELTQLALE